MRLSGGVTVKTFDTMLISEIKVGKRRREDFGDIEGLAESIGEYGLFHPVVVDDKRNLIAGERRLRACKLLKWQEVPVRRYRDLSDEERLKIELEENLRRKDLTPYEESKKLVADAGEIAPLLSSAVEDKTPRGKKRQYEVPKKEVARALGVSVGKLVNAEQHVAAVKKHPDLKGSTQREAIEKGKEYDAVERYPVLAKVGGRASDLATMAANLDSLPEPERKQKLALIKKGDSDTITDLANKPRMPKPQPPSAQDAWRDFFDDSQRALSKLGAHGTFSKYVGLWDYEEKQWFLGRLRDLISTLNSVEDAALGSFDYDEGAEGAASEAAVH
jgi:ParB-like chromosome segregation protein Spo0J